MSTAAPVAPTTAALSSPQQMKTPSSGMIVGMTVNQPAPSTMTMVDHSPNHGNALPDNPSNGVVLPNNSHLKSEGAPVPPPNQDTSNTNVANTKEKTPMCLINELARFNKIQHQYRLTDESGPAHKKTFIVLLKLGEEEYTASGLSIKKAQHAAATAALKQTNYKHPPPKPKRNFSKLNMDNLTPTVELNALAMKRGEPTIYSVMEPSRPNPYAPQNLNYRGAYHQRYHYQRYQRACYVSLRVGTRAFIGEGVTMQMARHNAAEKALRVLKSLPLPEVNSDSEVTQENGHHNLSEDDELKSPISLVHEVALKRDMRVDFEVVRESGPPHMRNFVTKCVVGNLVTEGEGNGKKLSKKRAAEKMLEELKKLPPLSPTILKVKKKPNTVKKKSRNLIKDQKANPDYGQGINPISRLIQIQQAKKEKEPVYTLVAESGMPCRREFVMQVQVGPHTCTGTGPNKKLAKRAAAEGLLQMLGYSRPHPQPSRPAMKSGGPEGDADRNRKVTFLDQDAMMTVERGDGESRSGRQLVPGVLLMTESLLANEGNAGIQNYQHQMGLGQNVNLTRTPAGLFPTQDLTIATIAKELLDHGTSPTAESILNSGQKLVPGQLLSYKQQLMYLADVLGFKVQFTDFPRGNKSEYLTLVSLSTTPPHVSHGAGENLEESHDQASLTALRALAELGLDAVTKGKKDSGPVSGLTVGVDNLHLGPSQNGTSKIGTANIEMTSNKA